MKTKIVLTNNISESEKLKSLAGFNQSCFDVRYMSPLELAEYLLQLSGIDYQRTFIKNDLLSAMMYEIVRKQEYFSKFSYNDILGLIETIQDVRYYILDNEEENFLNRLPTDQFQKKNNAIKEVYKWMRILFEDQNLIDEVDVIRFAIDNIKPFEDIEFVKYELSHLRPLESHLLDVAAGKEVQETKICEEDKPLHIESYTKAFGQSNEIEDILAYIYKNNIHFDECVIASSSGANYSNILTNYRDLLGFPMTIGLGKPIASTNPGQLFSCLYDWENNYFHGDYLKAIIYSQSFDLEKFKKDIEFPEDLTEINKDLKRRNQITFDNFMEIVGDLKISFDEKSNNLKLTNYESLVDKYNQANYNEDDTKPRVRTIPILRNVVEKFNKGESNFLTEYSLIKDEKMDKTALKKILKLLSFEKDFGVNREDVVKQIFGQTVSRELPQPGSLYFTSISRASSCLRKYLFIVGLSSSNFPGKNVENPIMLDRDYEMFGEKEASTREIRNNKDDYFALLEEAKKYDVKVYLSWSCYNEETLKNQNSSSVVFESYQKEDKGQEKTIADFEKEFKNNKDKFRYVEYFDSELLPITPIGKAVINDEEVTFEQVQEDLTEKTVPVKKMLEDGYAFSASAVYNYAQCPYMFFLKNLLGIESEKEIDPTEVIPANDYGTIAHDLLEHLNIKKTGREDFLKRADERFEEYLIYHPTDNSALKNKAKEDFLETMSNAYDMETSFDVALAEQDIYFTDKGSGLTIHGKADKILKTKERHFIVVDYKTGRTVSHDVNKSEDMIQCTMYSYIFKEKHSKENYVIDDFEYRYIRTGDVIHALDDEHTMEEHFTNLKETLKQLKQSLETGDFPAKTSHCRDCFVKDFCRKKK